MIGTTFLPGRQRRTERLVDGYVLGCLHALAALIEVFSKRVDWERGEGSTCQGRLRSTTSAYGGGRRRGREEKYLPRRKQQAPRIVVDRLSSLGSNDQLGEMLAKDAVQSYNFASASTSATKTQEDIVKLTETRIRWNWCGKVQPVPR